jgi:tetratricopeptide (TPR) repeat protein
LTIAERLPEDPWRLNRAALHYQAARKFDRALPLFEEALALRKARLGSDHPDTLSSMNNLARGYQAAGELDRALPLWRELVDRWKRKAGADSPQYARVLVLLSSDLLLQEKWVEAEPVLREILTIRESTQPDGWMAFNARSRLGGALLGQKKFDDAEPLLRAGYEGMKQRAEKIPAQDRGQLAAALNRLIKLAEATNRPEDARKWKDERTKLSRAPAPKPDAENP